MDIKRIDFCDYEALVQEVEMFQPSIVLNTASYGSVQTENSSEKMYVSNFIGSKNLLDASIINGLETFLTIGSSEEYGDSNGKITEETPILPISDYGLSKALFSLICNKEAVSKNLPIYIVRPFAAYGPYMDPEKLIAKMFLSSFRNIPMNIYRSQNIRDFIYIEDLIDLILMICQKQPSEQRIFNAGTGVLQSVQNVIQKGSELLNGKFAPVYNECPGAIFHGYKKDKFADWSRINTILHWKPTYNIDAGLEATLRWFEKNQALYNCYTLSENGAQKISTRPMLA